MMELYVPLGFMDSRDMMIHTSRLILQWGLSENFAILSDPLKAPLLKHLVLMFAYWLTHPMTTDTFFLQTTIDSILQFLKSEKFATALKSLHISHVLITITKDEKVPPQIKTKILRIIKYLAAETFLDTYAPKEMYRPQSRKGESHKHHQPMSHPTAAFKTDSLDAMKQHMEHHERQGSAAAVPHLHLDRYGKQESHMTFANDPEHRDFLQKVSYQERSHTHHGQEHSVHQEQHMGHHHTGHGRTSEPPQRLPSRRMQTFTTQAHPVTTTSKGARGPQTMMDEVKPYFGAGEFQEALYMEYVSLLDQSNTKELLSFAIQNLSGIIEDNIYGVMQNKPIFLKLLGLIELNFPSEDRECLKKVLVTIAKSLTEDRALDGIQANVIERLLKAFNRSGHDFHEIYAALIMSHIVKSKYDVRVNSLVEMLKTPYNKLQDLSTKILRDISRPGQGLKRDYTPEFENHVRFLLESTLSKDRSVLQVNQLVEVIANLCISEYLSRELIHHGAIDVLLRHLREKGNIEGQRLAARGLLNLGAKSRENKLRIVSDLDYEIRAMHKGELDPTIRSYISTLIQAKGGSERDPPPASLQMNKVGLPGTSSLNTLAGNVSLLEY